MHILYNDDCIFHPRHLLNAIHLLLAMPLSHSVVILLSGAGLRVSSRE